MNTGRWPDPPPVAIATLPGTGASARTIARPAGIRSWPGCAATIPSSISSTNWAGSLRIFCIGLPRCDSRPAGRGRQRQAGLPQDSRVPEPEEPTLDSTLNAFALSFGVILLAELGDKSQLMALAFATRY